MRRLLPLIAIIVMSAAAAFADQTNLLMNIEIIRDSGVREFRPVRITGWHFHTTTNDGEYSIGSMSFQGGVTAGTTNTSIGTAENPIHSIFCSGNSLHIGGQKVSEEDGAIKIKKLMVDVGADTNAVAINAKGKIKAEKGDTEVVDHDFGLVLNSKENGGISAKKWLIWADEYGAVQSTDISTVVTAAVANVSSTFKATEIPQSQRVADMNERRARVKKTRDNWGDIPPGQIQERLEKVEAFLGLRPLDE